VATVQTGRELLTGVCTALETLAAQKHRPVRRGTGPARRRTRRR
jgi:hypothetical protein